MALFFGVFQRHLFVESLHRFDSLLKSKVNRDFFIQHIVDPSQEILFMTLSL